MSRVPYPDNRLPDSSGGPPKTSPRFNGPDIEVTRDPLVNNSQIFRDKKPWLHHAYRTPPPVTPGDWNASGPVPMSLHVRTFTYRKEAGAFHSDTTGMHTMLPDQSNRDQKSRVQRPYTMQAGRQNRLTTSIYRGQSYSDTTQIYGSPDTGAANGS